MNIPILPISSSLWNLLLSGFIFRFFHLKVLSSLPPLWFECMLLYFSEILANYFLSFIFNISFSIDSFLSSYAYCEVFIILENNKKFLILSKLQQLEIFSFLLTQTLRMNSICFLISHSLMNHHNLASTFNYSIESILFMITSNFLLVIFSCVVHGLSVVFDHADHWVLLFLMIT